jgi:hypothetical protein
METHEEKTIPRINARHFKKIRNGLNLLMIKAAAIFRMLNDTNEEDEEYKQDAYAYVTFLLTKHIQDKVGKKIPKGNVYRRIPKKKAFTIGEKIEGKDVIQELRETQIRSDKTMKMMNDIVANCDYLREMNNNQIYHEWVNDQVREVREENKNSKKREREKLMNITMEQIYEMGKYTQEIT